jgi:lipoprotein NlpI
MHTTEMPSLWRSLKKAIAHKPSKKKQSTYCHDDVFIGQSVKILYLSTISLIERFARYKRRSSEKLIVANAQRLQEVSFLIAHRYVVVVAR